MSKYNVSLNDTYTGRSREIHSDAFRIEDNNLCFYNRSYDFLEKEPFLVYAKGSWESVELIDEE